MQDTTVLYCNIDWCVKDSAVHCSCLQWLEAIWLGLVLQLGIRASEVNVTNAFVLLSWHVNSMTFMA